jgi:hypothetical protein
LYSSGTGVFLRIKMLQESSNDLSHSNSPLHWILESKIRQDQKANVLAENPI